MLPDSLTEMELLANLPDISMLLGEGVDLGRLTVEPGLTLDWDTQNLLPDSSEKRELEVPRAYDEGDLGLELGVEGDLTSTLDIERGRERVEAPWEGDLGLDLGEEPVTTISLGEPSAGGDLEMAEYPGLDLGEVTTLEITAQPEEPIEVTQRIKRRKVIALDSDLELKNSQIRDQQTDRSKIVKPVSFLPRDPFLLTLLAIQKSGGFVSSILGDTRTFDWAPELRDVLSVSIIRKSGDLKRKRDSGVSDTYLDAERPELEIPEDGSAMIAAALEAEISHIGMEEELPSLYRGEEEEEEEEEEAAPLSPVAGFDETTMPLLHPAEAGRISLATRHAVHLLRDHFGAAAAESLEERQRTSVLFQELLPERTSSRSQATKLFFEVLVLATKDAIKVEQRSDVLGRPIQLRAKRGLWGAWAEQGAGGQIQETQAGVT
jgi:cohesin complex subunit SCC1